MHDTRPNREVAIKVLPAIYSQDADAVSSMKRAISALNQPNILTIYDIDTHEGRSFMAASRLTWFDRYGKPTGVLGDSALYPCLD